MAIRLHTLAKGLLVSTSSPTTVITKAVTTSSTLTTAIAQRIYSKPALSHIRMAHSSATTAAAATATSEPRKFEWLVVVPDKPGALAKRLEVRPKHFEGLTKMKEGGNIKMGGAVFDDLPVDDDPSNWKFAGSTLMVVAESKQAVIDLIKDDVYVTSGVWDLDKAMIWPAKIAFRFP